MNQLSDIHLPITEVIPAIKKTLAKENRLIISAPPGAGKSTLLPISLINEMLDELEHFDKDIKN